MNDRPIFEQYYYSPIHIFRFIPLTILCCNIFIGHAEKKYLIAQKTDLWRKKRKELAKETKGKPGDRRRLLLPCLQNKEQKAEQK